MARYSLVLIYESDIPMISLPQVRLEDSIVVPFQIMLEDIIKRGFATVEALTSEVNNIGKAHPPWPTPTTPNPEQPLYRWWGKRA